MKLAVIKTGGKQYKVAEGSKIKVEKLSAKGGSASGGNATAGSMIDFDQVLLVADGDKVEIGRPALNNVKVKAKVLAQGKGPKIRVVKYKPKVRYHKVFGHRQPFTEVEIEKIG